MLFKKNLLIALLVGICILSAASASAAGLIPDCGPGGCNLCDIWPLADKIINLLLFVLAIPVLTVMIIWGGVLWTTAGASPGNIEQGKKIIQSAIIGIIIAFSGWLIVDTIIKSLASGSVVGAWQAFPDKASCENPNLANEQITFQDVVPGAGSGDTTVAPDGYYTHAEAIAALGGIPTNHNNQNCSGPVPTQCGSRPAGSPTDCTSLDFIPKSTVQKLKALKDLGVIFYISGGTEAGHKTHGLCKPNIDLVPGIPGSKKLSELPFLHDAVQSVGAIGNKTFCELPAGAIVDCSTSGADHLHVQFSL